MTQVGRPIQTVKHNLRVQSYLDLGQRAVVRIDGELFGCCIIGQGGRKGCPLSPLLFNIYIHMFINEALEDVEEGVKVGGVKIPAVRFAGDQAMISVYEDCKILWMHCRIHLRSTA